MRMVVRYESLMLIGLVVAGLLVAGLMVAAAAVLSRYDGLLEGASFTVAIIGGGAGILLSLTLLLWFRGFRGSHHWENGVRPDTVMEGS